MVPTTVAERTWTIANLYQFTLNWCCRSRSNNFNFVVFCTHQILHCNGQSCRLNSMSLVMKTWLIHFDAKFHSMSQARALLVLLSCRGLEWLIEEFACISRYSSDRRHSTRDVLCETNAFTFFINQFKTCKERKRTSVICGPATPVKDVLLDLGCMLSVFYKRKARKERQESVHCKKAGKQNVLHSDYHFCHIRYFFLQNQVG